jgi:predicted amidohydrolase
MLSVAVIQVCATDQAENNLLEALKYTKTALDSGAKFVALPECFQYIGSESGRAKIATSIEGPVVQEFSELAKSYEAVILLGSIIESQLNSQLTYNTSVLIDANGTVAASYRKIHLFDIDIPGKVTLKESSHTSAGSEIVSAETAVGHIGLSVCYDLRFPELYRILREQGAKILTVPAAFTHHTGSAHWFPLLRARAIENQCFVIAPGQVGQHNPKRRSFGHSTIIDPWGRVLATQHDAPGIAIAALELDLIEPIRAQIPCQSHRRIATTYTNPPGNKLRPNSKEKVA